MNVEVVHVVVLHFKIRRSLIDIRYSKNWILPRFMYNVPITSGLKCMTPPFTTFTFNPDNLGTLFSSRLNRNFTPFHV
jgi:hypothetical protein